jgi:hypothetical protein
MSAKPNNASDVDLTRDLDCIVHLDAEVSNSAVDFRTPEQELDWAQCRR